MSCANCNWSTEQSFLVAKDGEEHLFRGKASQILRDQKWGRVDSVSGAIEKLEEGQIDGTDGIYIVHSESHKGYYCVYRFDKAVEAHEIFGKELSPQAIEVMKEKADQIIPHRLVKRSFIVPTWCDLCKGILVGTGYQCQGACGLRCHAGLGDGTENCRADMLCFPCKPGKSHASGQYKFGDITRQLARNVHQKVKDQVVGEIIKEQREFGKFDRLKEQMHALQDQWDDSKVIYGTLLLQLASVVLTVVMMYLVVSPLSITWTMANLQASLLVASLLLHETLVVLGIHLLARGMIKYSALVHTFVLTILQINLEDIEINLDDAGHALVRVSRVVLIFSAASYVVATALWVRLLQVA